MYVLSKTIKNIIFFFLVKFSFFTAEKNLCILHGKVFRNDKVEAILAMCGYELLTR